IPAEVLADALASGTATWLLEQSMIQDAADVFLQRNAQAPEQSQQELRSFLDWSAPSFAPSGAGAKKVDPRVAVLLPASVGGQTLANAVHELDDERIQKFATHSGSEVHFVQTATSPTLGRLAPAWLLRGRAAYESPKYRVSAVVYPQTVDV